MVLNVYVKHFFRRHVDNILLGLITTQHKHKSKYTTTNTQLQIHNNEHTQLQIKYTTTNTRQQIKYTTTNTRQQIHIQKPQLWFCARKHRQLWEAHQSGRVCASKAPTKVLYRPSQFLNSDWAGNEAHWHLIPCLYYTKCRDVWVGLAKYSCLSHACECELLPAGNHNYFRSK